jgi:uncharacterized membrane protein YdjX (TVP38/TMEM64 family)
MTARRRVVAVVVPWAVLVAGWIVFQRASGLGPVATAQRLVDTASGNWWAMAAYVAVAVARPLVLFPASLLTVAAGILFGPVAGTVVAAVSANGSALVAHQLGRLLRRPPTVTDDPSRIGVWAQRLRDNGFEAVLLMRLVFLPYDLVSYACGVLHVRRGAFLAANALGTLPGTVAFVLVGASVTRVDGGLDGIDPVTLGASVVLVVASIVTARVVRRRRGGGEGGAGPSAALGPGDPHR